MIDENNYDGDDELGEDHDHDLALELSTQSQIFLEMRQQNIDLLEIAVKVAGLAGEHPPIKSGDVRSSLKSIWDIYSELYTWVDPEEAEGDDDDLIDEDDDE